jgi:hypothetical protein
MRPGAERAAMRALALALLLAGCSGAAAPDADGGPDAPAVDAAQVWTDAHLIGPYCVTPGCSCDAGRSCPTWDDAAPGLEAP